MKPIVNILSGLTLGSLFNTAIVIVLDQEVLIPAFAFASAMLAFITVGIYGVDKRVRRNLMRLAEEVMAMALDKDKAQIYQEAVLLVEQIQKGRSLTDAAADIGRLANAVEAAVATTISSEV